jgi:hypothetical protein
VPPLPPRLALPVSLPRRPSAPPSQPQALAIDQRAAAPPAAPPPPLLQYVSNYLSWATVPQRAYNGLADWPVFNTTSPSFGPENMASSTQAGGGDAPWATVMGTYEVRARHRAPPGATGRA